MQIDLQNPIALLSLNVLGVGVDLAYGKTIDEHTLSLTFNFVFGSISKVWVKRRG